MSHPKLLVTRRVFPEVLELLRERFEVDANPADEPWPAAALRERVRDRDALYVTGSDRVDAALLEAAPALRIVASGSVGYNHVDLAACGARGIVVTNTPGVLDEATADMAWALLMAAARRLSESERWLRAGHWKAWAWDQFLGQDVHGATLGIVGMGRIGSAIARRARGFDMRLLYCNRTPAPNAAELGAQRRGLDALLRESDHVVLVVPYSQQTHHLIGARELGWMKPGATLVNIARGGIVDDAALVRALRAGRPGAAGLDVYENEPALDPALLEVPNVVLAPHLGSATRSSRLGMAMLAARNLMSWAEGAGPLTPVPLPD
ncbi:2-hydroxyacid dehydrogenase [Quisquiliibacterium transsilvanicum]|uniref:Gluconate 2-dehydrogenase n=1 Tax=Quisquiliibacterium transsilvanicum TaxID=1549638 RepID=A0A7W8M882_9BURK|nr:D-glycerate dehydrogenase [Quisquiliibacterium transsilvanicum]MBB5271000.1 gluconate 2-dehydrogenase [Quisquiliibacterium transsilvanicum]